jgi:hypothetical protein
MRVLNLTNAVTNLADAASPFWPGSTVVAANTSAGALQLEGSPDGTTGWAALGAPIGIGAFVEIQLNAPYVRVSTAATVALLSN